MKQPQAIFLGCSVFLFTLFSVEAAADFKIRYNQKFPCLEVMDSNAVKITDVTEGAKGVTVTSGKSSLNISFIKNGSGQPEVTLREAIPTFRNGDRGVWSFGRDEAGGNGAGAIWCGQQTKI